VEKEVAEDQRQTRQRELTASGVKGKVAQAEVAATTDWWVLSGLMTEESYPVIAMELDKVRDWRTNGSDDDKAPATPALDRLAILCKKTAVSYPFLLEVLRIAKDRNFTAHHAPPPGLEDHLKADGEVDWKAVKNACEGFKTRLRDLYHAEFLTEDRLAIFLKTVDTSLSVHVEKWKEGGDAVETKYGDFKKGIGKRQTTAKRKRQAASVPFSPYKRGKWDDVVPPGE
jgi:hypothetical protein